MFHLSPSPLEEIHCRFFPGLQVWVKRDDLLHPQVSGNKFRKLKYPLTKAKANMPRLVSMGGPWSNHLHALAYAAKQGGFASLGLVRGLVGENDTLTPTLRDCADLGMHLTFVSRIAYRALRDDPHAWQAHCDYPPQNSLWLPEGGSTALALQGVAELIGELPDIPDAVILACGSGGTLAGILAGLAGRSQVTAIAAVQNADYLRAKVIALLQEAGHPPYQNFDILHHCDHGGFGKTTPEFMQFCAAFEVETNIPIEPIYTGKMFFALHKLAEAGHFKHGARVIAIHTGGLQGKRGFQGW